MKLSPSQVARMPRLPEPEPAPEVEAVKVPEPAPEVEARRPRASRRDEAEAEDVEDGGGEED